MLLCKNLEEWLEKNRESIHWWTPFQLLTSTALVWCCHNVVFHKLFLYVASLCLWYNYGEVLFKLEKKIFFQKNCCQAYSPSFDFCLNLCLISKAESCYPVEPWVTKVQYFWNLKIKKSFLIFKCLCFKFGNYHILRTKIARSVFGSFCPALASKSSTICSDCCCAGKPAPCGDIACMKRSCCAPYAYLFKPTYRPGYIKTPGYPIRWVL